MSEERIEPERGVLEWLAAVACFILGVLSLAIGFVLTTDRLLDAHLHPSLHAVGIVLLVIGIPVVILGGHFMDLGEKKNGHVVVVLLLAVLFTPGYFRSRPSAAGANGSGLDPHISAAEFQVPRVARERGMSEDELRQIVAAHTEGWQFGLLGEPRVNVLELNIALDNRR